MQQSTLDSPASASVLVSELSPELSSEGPQPALTDIAVVGLGYVALPLSLQFARCGVSVLGFDLDPEKVDAVTRGEAILSNVPVETVAEEVKARRLEATTDFSRVDEVHAVINCVPTPLNKNRQRLS